MNDENNDDGFFGDKPDKITENILLGSMDYSSDKNYLVKEKITHILVAGSYLDEHFPDDFKYLTIPINDHPSENIYNYFMEAFEFIENAIINGGNILIHCAAGVSRSATITIAYLMQKNNLSLKEAFDFVKSKRSVIYPNTGFIKQLEKLEKEIKEKNKIEKKEDEK